MLFVRDVIERYARDAAGGAARALVAERCQALASADGDPDRVAVYARMAGEAYSYDIAEATSLLLHLPPGMDQVGEEAAYRSMTLTVYNAATHSFSWAGSAQDLDVPADRRGFPAGSAADLWQEASAEGRKHFGPEYDVFETRCRATVAALQRRVPVLDRRIRAMWAIEDDLLASEPLTAAVAYRRTGVEHVVVGESRAEQLTAMAGSADLRTRTNTVTSGLVRGLPQVQAFGAYWLWLGEERLLRLRAHAGGDRRAQLQLGVPGAARAVRTVHDLRERAVARRADPEGYAQLRHLR